MRPHDKVRNDLAEVVCTIGPLQYDGFIRGFDAATKYWLERSEKLVGALVTINCGLVTTLDTAKYAGLRPKDIASLVLEEWAKEIE